MLATGGFFVAWSEEIQPRLGGGKYGEGDAAAVAAPTRQRCWSSCWPLLELACWWLGLTFASGPRFICFELFLFFSF